MALVKKIIKALEYRWAKSSELRFTWWLRKRGCKIGEGVRWYGVQDIHIDTTRPSLIEIGNNVIFTRGCTIVTHDIGWQVLRNIYGEVLASSGRVKIGNNVLLGTCAFLLKGTTIGDNCIIGAYSVVTKDIPSGSVASGNPARVICTMEEYYHKRKKLYIHEAKQYAQSIQENLGREPVPADFWEEFPLFLAGGEKIDGCPFSIKHQLGSQYEKYRMGHQPFYKSFDDFLIDAGVRLEHKKRKIKRK